MKPKLKTRPVLKPLPSANLKHLRAEGHLQTHHMRAAEWVRCETVGSAGLASLQARCAAIQTMNHGYDGDLFKTVIRVCRKGGTFAPGVISMGCFREALNEANRLRLAQSRKGRA